MPDSYGPRTYLVGRIISALIMAHPDWDEFQLSDIAVTVADKTIDRMSRTCYTPQQDADHDRPATRLSEV